MLKISKYTVIHETEGGVLLYNLKNGAQIFVNNKEKNLIDDLLYLKKNECNNVKNDILKKAFCVPDDFDEVQEVMASYYKQMFDPSNLAFIIMPNNICNFRCKYCYQEHGEKKISDDNINKFIKAIKNYYYDCGLKDFYIEWFGGEPFVSFDIIKKVTDELNDFFYGKNVKYHYGATTNGSLFSKDQIGYLLNNKFDFFQITLDGSKETHNKNRPLADGKPTWDIIFNNLKIFNSFKEFDFHISIRVNYNNETFEGINELFDAIKDNLDSRFTIFFHTIGKWGGENDENLDVIDYSIEPYTTVMLMDEAIKKGIEPLTNYNYYNPFQRICYAGLPYHFTLGSDGKLRKCNEEDEELDKFNVVGTIENEKIEFNLYKWSRFVLPNGKIELDNKCRECIYLPVCFAQSCPKSRIINGQNCCPNDFIVTSEVLMNKYNYMIKSIKRE